MAVLHKNKLISQANDNDAIRFFELVPKLGPLSKLLLGMLYYDVQGHNHNPSKGIDLVEDAISQYIKEDGNDEDIDYSLCYEIARVFYDYSGNTNNADYAWKALDYFGKTYARGQGSPQAEVAKKTLEHHKVLDEETVSKIVSIEKYYKFLNDNGVPANMRVDYEDLYNESESLRFTDSEIRSYVMNKDNRAIRLFITLSFYQRCYLDSANAANKNVREMFPVYDALAKQSERLNYYLRKNSC